MLLVWAHILNKFIAGGTAPPTYTPALKFNDKRNSMYFALLFSEGL
jgi:hypothetical protein